jgi:hypothetical protein
MYVQYGHLHIFYNDQAQTYSVYVLHRPERGRILYALPIFVYLRTCGSFKSASHKKIGSANRKSAKMSAFEESPQI